MPMPVPFRLQQNFLKIHPSIMLNSVNKSSVRKQHHQNVEASYVVLLVQSITMLVLGVSLPLMQERLKDDLHPCFLEQVVTYRSFHDIGKA